MSIVVKCKCKTNPKSDQHLYFLFNKRYFPLELSNLGDVLMWIIYEMECRGIVINDQVMS